MIIAQNNFSSTKNTGLNFYGIIFVFFLLLQYLVENPGRFTFHGIKISLFFEESFMKYLIEIYAYIKLLRVWKQSLMKLSVIFCKWHFWTFLNVIRNPCDCLMCFLIFVSNFLLLCFFEFEISCSSAFGTIGIWSCLQNFFSTWSDFFMLILSCDWIVNMTS